MQLLVMAKEPVPGRVKTRLSPPCSPEEAAALAEAALADTLESSLASGADEVILALDGRLGPWCPAGVRVIPQCPGTFDQRLTAAWAATSGTAVQIGMDTPQVTSPLLDDAMATSLGSDAVLGPATDGGWWLIGLQQAHPCAFQGLPMSRPDTARHQLARLDELGLACTLVAELTDVDRFSDATSVAAGAPGTRFARVLASMQAEAGR